MTDYKAAAKHWAEVEDWSKSEPSNSWDNCILELRSRVEQLEEAAHKHTVETSANILALASRVETLEGKYETQRLATLEWGKDVDKVKRWSDQNLRRIEALETNSSAGLASSNHPAKPDSSLVERVAEVMRTAAAVHRIAHPWDDGAIYARAAIQVVAAWLEQEVER